MTTCKKCGKILVMADKHRIRFLCNGCAEKEREMLAKYGYYDDTIEYGYSCLSGKYDCKHEILPETFEKIRYVLDKKLKEFNSKCFVEIDVRKSYYTIYGYRVPLEKILYQIGSEICR